MKGVAGSRCAAGCRTCWHLFHGTRTEISLNTSLLSGGLRSQVDGVALMTGCRDNRLSSLERSVRPFQERPPERAAGRGMLASDQNVSALKTNPSLSPCFARRCVHQAQGGMHPTHCRGELVCFGEVVDAERGLNAVGVSKPKSKQTEREVRRRREAASPLRRSSALIVMPLGDDGTERGEGQEGGTES